MATAKTQHNYVELVLTCVSWQEAQGIADHLLNKRLIACAKFLPIKSKFWWEGELESVKEVMIMMESVEHYFEKIEAEVASLHSYKTFVLKAMPIVEVSKAASAWLENSVKPLEITE